VKIAPAAHWRKISAALKGKNSALRLLYVLYYGSNAAWYPFFNVYLRQIGMTGLQIGALASIRPAAMLVSQPVWGAVADMWGRRRALLVTMALSAGLVVGFAGGQSFWFLFGWVILHALLSSPVGALLDSLVLDHLESQPKLSYGQFRLWGAVGWAVLAVVVGRLVSGQDMRLIFPFGAILMLSGWLLAWLTTRGELSGRVSLGRSWRGLAPLLHNRRLLTFLALIVLSQVGAASVFSFYPVYMAAIGASSSLIGMGLSLQGLSELPLYLSAAAIIRRLGATKTLIFAFLIFATRTFLYSSISNPALGVAVEALHGLSFSLYLVASVDYVNRQVPAEWRATGQSLFWAAHVGAGGILGNAWAGFLYDRIGVQSMFRLNGLIIVAVALAALVALRGDRDLTP
jgi:PPP family 3-phenylpropionic acid transporter